MWYNNNIRYTVSDPSGGMIMKLKQVCSRMLSALFAAVIPLTAAIQQGPSVSAAATPEEEIRNAIEQCRKTSVDMTKYFITADELTDLFYSMMYTESSWFYVRSFSYGTIAPGSSIVQNFKINYFFDTDDIPEMKDELNDAISRIVGGIHPEWSQAETVLYLHDMMTDRSEYDFSYTNYDAYSALITGKATCQGYALAMNLLCRAAGIPCYAITSNALKHMWNVVQVDGEWYQLDSTNDDLAPNMLGHAMHSYVLCSDDYMQADENHSADDWNYYSDGNVITCSSKAYDDAFWVGSLDTFEAMPDGTFLYAMMNDPETIRYKSQIYTELRRGSLTSAPVSLGTLKSYWNTPDGNIYTGCYITTEVYQNKIYYHTADGIYSMPLSGGSAELIYTLSDAEKEVGSIYGMQIDDRTGILTYQIMDRADFPSSTDLTVQREFHTIQLAQPVIADTTTTETETTTTTTDTSTTTTSETTTTTTSETTTTTTSEITTTTSEGTTTTTTVESTTTTTAAAPETTTTETTFEITTTTAAPETTTTDSTTTTTSETTAAPVSTLRGDTDCNGEVNIMDAVLLARVAAEDTKCGITEQGKLNADTTQDGTVGSNDLTWLLKFLAGLFDQ